MTEAVSFRKVIVQEERFEWGCVECGGKQVTARKPPEHGHGICCEYLVRERREKAARAEEFARYAHLVGARVVGLDFTRSNVPRLCRVLLAVEGDKFHLVSPRLDSYLEDSVLNVQQFDGRITYVRKLLEEAKERKV